MIPQCLHHTYNKLRTNTHKAHFLSHRYHCYYETALKYTFTFCLERHKQKNNLRVRVKPRKRNKKVNKPTSPIFSYLILKKWVIHSLYKSEKTKKYL